MGDSLIRYQRDGAHLDQVLGRGHLGDLDHGRGRQRRLEIFAAHLMWTRRLEGRWPPNWVARGTRPWPPAASPAPARRATRPCAGRPPLWLAAPRPRHQVPWLALWR